MFTLDKNPEIEIFEQPLNIFDKEIKERERDNKEIRQLFKKRDGHVLPLPF